MSQSTPYRQTSINYRTQHIGPAANTLSLRCIGVDDAVNTYFKPAIKLLFFFLAWFKPLVNADGSLPRSEIPPRVMSRVAIQCGMGLWASGPNQNNCFLSAVYLRLFNIFAANLQIWKPPLPSGTWGRAMKQLLLIHGGVLLKKLALIGPMSSSIRQRFLLHQLPISQSNQHVILQCLS